MAFAEADPTLTDERLGLKIERCHRAGQSLTGSPTSHANSRVAGASQREPATHGCLSLRHRTDKHLATEGLQAIAHVLQATTGPDCLGLEAVPVVLHREMQPSIIAPDLHRPSTRAGVLPHSEVLPSSRK